MKKWVGLLLVVCMVLLAGVSLGETQRPGDWEYTIQEDGTAYITDYKGKAENLTIPDVLDGYSVTSIGDDVFSGCPSVSLEVTPGSYAEQYAKDNHIFYTYAE